jgi:hypothetical protein
LEAFALLATAQRAFVEVGGGAAVGGLATDRFILAGCALALAMLLLVLGRCPEIGAAAAFLLGAILGVAFFVQTLGSALVDPRNVEWLLKRDWRQHYLGWAFFREESWHWPLGAIRGLLDPVGTSVVYTDSLPLFALALKPFAGWLPERFQYIGASMGINFLLQGAFGALIGRFARPRPAAATLGALYFLFAPALVAHLGHDTLTAHWLLVAGITLCLYRPSDGAPLAWLALAAISALVHPYLCAMVLGLALAGTTIRWRVQGLCSLREVSFLCAAMATVVLAGWWLAGAFTLAPGSAVGGVPIGYYSFNLLGFVDPMYTSRWLPEMPRGPGQYEGFAYPGLGILLLLPLTVLLAARGGPMRTLWRQHWPLIVLSVGCLLFAASNVVMLGERVVFRWPVRPEFLGMFRASGRFVLVPYYLLLTLVLVVLLRRLPYPVAVAVLSVAILVQVLDLSNFHARLGLLRAGVDQAPTDALLRDPAWDTWTASRGRIVMLPPSSCGEQAAKPIPLMELAARRHMRLNTGYTARWDAVGMGEYCEVLLADIAAGRYAQDELYIVQDRWWPRVQAHAPPAMKCAMIDGLRVCAIGRDAASSGR